jgi:hypothetical protein
MPSISLFNTPDYLSPVNSELWFVLSSASSSTTDFKYIFRLNKKSEPFSTEPYIQLLKYKMPPRPDNGYGIYSPHKMLKSYFEYNLTPGSIGFSGADDGLVKYYMDYGFEYNPSIRWGETYDISGYLGLSFSTSPGLTAGDIITLNKDNKTVNSEYDGTSSVTQVINTNLIKTDKPIGSGYLLNESGTITSLLRLSATTSEYLTWNGTRQYNEIGEDFTNKWTLVGSTSSFLTNYNQTYKSVFSDNWETISMILNTPLGNDLILSTYNSSGSLLNTFTSSIQSNQYQRGEFGVGPKNLEALLPGSMIDVKTYNIKIKASGVTMSETKSYIIDENCSVYNNTRIVFLNRNGGWDYFNFTLDNKKKLNIQRTEWNRVLDWDYSVGDRGRTNLTTKTTESFTINSNWITEGDVEWLSELLTSPEVYHLTETSDEYSFGTGLEILSYANNGGYLRVNLTGTHSFSVGDYIQLYNTNPLYNNNSYQIRQINSTSAFTLNTSSVSLSLSGTDFCRKRTTTGVIGGELLPVIITDSSYEFKTALRDKLFNLQLNYEYAYNINIQNQ